MKAIFVHHQENYIHLDTDFLGHSRSSSSTSSSLGLSKMPFLWCAHFDDPAFLKNGVLRTGYHERACRTGIISGHSLERISCFHHLSRSIWFASFFGSHCQAVESMWIWQQCFFLRIFILLLNIARSWSRTIRMTSLGWCFICCTKLW